MAVLLKRKTNRILDDSEQSEQINSESIMSSDRSQSGIDFRAGSIDETSSILPKHGGSIQFKMSDIMDSRRSSEQNYKLVKKGSRRLRNYDDDKSLDEDSDEGDSVEPEAATTQIDQSPDQDQMRPNPRFKNYADIFKSLVKQQEIPSMYPICSMIITYDSTRVIVVSR